ncbi:YceK/YidQ family lipoprotein [Pseudomonas sp. FW306-02-F02-AA]|nr:YceK/YidQ family lipoprotein [Pseudomonas sp. FW306-02-F02-AB]PMZ10182.1 YceK/YidQ family lipoprotein [Pseudomonas sp. FW306-02-H06C]PMZ13236.1 YceK/YidQ family lipoprotein [Pseudomonas sp. FW306-02-F02-AA]PMZ19280.1 YceK/YidQ family lipoprotein [Pseudomonas sp. FW306-02-F08-AA]PMZ27082.1 YceK/YidQ family lipoprotein [Pseudomonas sp. FW306-02-F04-BA]PMZ31690.1 YceK/YidQ family lipoprotein [Pseudomonas sp. FW306-02-H06B]PMZ37651.1 YceK/YidQ family lipoprotein [Pseudomonas sp. FW306-2-11AB]
MLIFSLSQLSGCAWLVANSHGSIACFNGTELEFKEMMPLVGPFIILDLPFTLVADTLSLPACL